MFNINKNTVTSEQVDAIIAPLNKRIEALEKALNNLTERLADLEKLQMQCVAGLAEATAVKTSSDESGPGQGKENGSDDSSEAGSSGLNVSASSSFFLPAPSPDGVFLNPTEKEQLGKSIYRMRTEDGLTGEFEILSSSDAIATAMISVSQFVKPACKVEGNINRQPQQILTVRQGTVQRDGDSWRVVTKAVVQFV
ncbi:MAG: hypothetical protein ACOYJF_08035 [Prevotella sp.]|jgi:hypothetical protein